jgi:ribosomal protein S18 acetylase RimI-like enzyme
MASAEEAARQRGARSITLHVFETNERARALYARKGFITEWLRCIKPLGENEDNPERP